MGFEWRKKLRNAGQSIGEILGKLRDPERSWADECV